MATIASASQALPTPFDSPSQPPLSVTPAVVGAKLILDPRSDVESLGLAALPPNTPMLNKTVGSLVADPDMTVLADTVFPNTAMINVMLLDTPTTAPGDMALGRMTATSVDSRSNLYSSEFQHVPNPQESIEPEPLEAFAKLQFPDGDFFVNTFAVELGRDMNAVRHERKRVKEERRRKENEDAMSASVVKAEDDPSADGPTLLDIPALGTDLPLPLPSPSAISEAGGIIGINTYSDEDDSMYSHPKPKWKHHSNDSSVAHSIAPATLHNNANDLTFTSNLFSDGATHDPEPTTAHSQECPFIPIHPQAGTVMNNISRKHIRIEFNGDKAYWELHVLGRNGVWVDEVYYGLGGTAKLVHGSYILVQSISIMFLLPDNARGDSDLVDSPASDPDSNTFSDVEAGDRGSQSDAAHHDSQTPSKNAARKIKLKLSRKMQPAPSGIKAKNGEGLDQPRAAQSGEKDDLDRASAAVTLAEGTTPSLSMEGKMRDSAQSTTPAKPSEPDVPAVPAADLPIGSVLAGVAPEDMPAKRKGPGRPPKNGVMSKRDEAIIKRKKKELQKAGHEIPPLADLLVMARAEAAGMTIKKDKCEDGQGDDDVRKSTEVGDAPSVIIAQPPGTVAVDADGQVTSSTGTPNRNTDDSAAKAVNKTARSPSPQKPEGSYTEEQLKKPNKTYVILIHEALEKSSSGIMDLQQIYDAIQKMYPYYKYRSQTQGWQSSIRHNLIGSEAFEEAGKIGKGRLWKINQNHPIDKEKKRKVATPEPERTTTSGQYSYSSGQYPYTNQGYPSYRPSPYGRPYGPPNALTNTARPAQAGQSVQAGQTASAPQKPGTYQSPYSPHPPTANANGGRPSTIAAQKPTAAGSTTLSTAAPRTNGVYQPPRPPQAGSASSSTPAMPSRAPAVPMAVGATASAAGKPKQAGAVQARGTGQGSTATPTQARQPTQPPQQQADGKGWEVTIEEIMTFNKDYLAQFKGEEQKEAKALFHRAVYRYIHKDRDHGPFRNDEERKVAEKIEGIIAKNNRFRKPAPRASTSASAGTAPRTAGAPVPPASDTAQRQTGTPQAGNASRPAGASSTATRPVGAPPGPAQRPAGLPVASAQRPIGAPSAVTTPKPAGLPQTGALMRPPGVAQALHTRPGVAVAGQPPRPGIPAPINSQGVRPAVPAPAPAPGYIGRSTLPGATGQPFRPPVPVSKAQAPRPGQPAPTNGQVSRPGAPNPAIVQAARPAVPAALIGQGNRPAQQPSMPRPTVQPQIGAPRSGLVALPAGPPGHVNAPGARPANYTAPRPPIQGQSTPAGRMPAPGASTAQTPVLSAPVLNAPASRPSGVGSAHGGLSVGVTPVADVVAQPGPALTVAAPASGATSVPKAQPAQTVADAAAAPQPIKVNPHVLAVAGQSVVNPPAPRAIGSVIQAPQSAVQAPTVANAAEPVKRVADETADEPAAKRQKT